MLYCTSAVLPACRQKGQKEWKNTFLRHEESWTWDITRVYYCSKIWLTRPLADLPVSLETIACPKAVTTDAVVFFNLKMGINVMFKVMFSCEISTAPLTLELPTARLFSPSFCKISYLHRCYSVPYRVLRRWGTFFLEYLLPSAVVAVVPSRRV